MKRRQVIDVDDYKIQVDLTADPPTIDLTQDNDLSGVRAQRSSRHPQTTGYPNHIPYSPTSPAPSHGNAKRKRPPDSSSGNASSNRMPRTAASGYGASTSSSVAASLLPCRPKHESVEVLTLDTDPSEDEVEYHLAYSSSPKKPRLNDDDCLEYDSSDDYEGFLLGMNDQTIWKPLPDMKHIPEEEKPQLGVVTSSISTALRRRGDRSPVMTRRNPLLSNELVNGDHTSGWASPRFCPVNRLTSLLPNVTTTPSRHFTIPKGLQSLALSRTSFFKQSPGCIMRVTQKEDWVVVCSTCQGGDPDSQDGGEIDAYNREGSLIVWHNGQEEIMEGHRRRVACTEDKCKHFSVNDVKFDPTSTSFVSSGNDKKVRAWQREPDTGEYVLDRVVYGKFTYVPNEIAFKPGTKKLAVAEKKIHIYADYDNTDERNLLSLIPLSSKHNVGGMCWGFGPTDNHIFASSEPEDDACFKGYHKAFDVERKLCLYDLDSDEAGDCIALTPDGNTLIHTSRGIGGKHPLRLYDVRRRNGRALEMVHMDAFQRNVNGEINSISISPDAIYIAFGRIDNRVHIYDSRMLKKGKLYEYEHKGKNLTPPGGLSCGVVEVQWAETEFSRLTLVSGGADGCIRLWDPLEATTSPMNGFILAQVNSDIGHFTLGDQREKEQQLVVGDCSGEVCIFNSARTYIRPLATQHLT